VVRLCQDRLSDHPGQDDYQVFSLLFGQLFPDRCPLRAALGRGPKLQLSLHVVSPSGFGYCLSAPSYRACGAALRLWCTCVTNLQRIRSGRVRGVGGVLKILYRFVDSNPSSRPEPTSGIRREVPGSSAEHLHGATSRVLAAVFLPGDGEPAESLLFQENPRGG